MTAADTSGAVEAPLHPRESERLQSLRALNVLDSASSVRFDRITALAASVFDVPTALISLVDENRQWFLSRCGFDGQETGRDVAFCPHALNEEVMLVIEDARNDARFATNPLVTGAPFIRFYAGVVLRDRASLPLGTLCLLAPEPRTLGEAERGILIKLGALVEDELLLDGASMNQRVSSQLNAGLDPLTQAQATPRFHAELAARIVRADAVPMATALVTTTGLEQLNEIFGRVVGDEVLVELAARLASIGERFSTHATGRLSGRRLALCVGGGPDGESIATLGDTVLQRLAEPFQTTAGELTPDIFTGIVAGASIGDRPEILLGRCRAALGTIRSTRGTHVALYDRQLEGRMLHRSRIAAELPGALEGDALHLVFQPKFRCSDRSLDGMECLLRWTHDELGDISPFDVLEAALDVNHLVAVDRWVIDRAVLQLRAWRRCGLDPGTLSINVTGETLASSGFVAYLAGILGRYDIAAEDIELEVLESSLFEDFDRTIGVLESLRALGVGLSLDDFGTGYSSLSYLSRLPVCVLKIDRSFVSRIERTGHDRSLCTSIIAIAHDLSLTVVAEGVENERQFEILRDHGCERVQGYLLARPMVAGAITPMLEDRALDACRNGGSVQRDEGATGDRSFAGTRDRDAA